MSHLAFQSLSKRFPGVKALDTVSFAVKPGTVHALLGENGAGKSTLLKLLCGVYCPDEGSILLDGRRCDFSCTADAIRAGIAVIQQELQLVPELSVAENLYLGRLPNRVGWVKGRSLFEQARAQLAALGEEIDPRARISSLPIAQRQMVEIAKSLARSARVIAFDEPTSSLSGREVERLFAVIRQLRAQGKIILYVSHRMEEIQSLCDAATVLRDGRHVLTVPSLADVSLDALVQAMVGRAITDVFHYKPRAPGPPILQVESLYGPGLSRPATFSLAQGEILGIFGLVGAGRTELLNLVCGATPPTSGSIRLHGRPLSIRSPRDAIRAGIALCPEDRKKQGIIPIRSVTENINLSARRHFSPLGCWIDSSRERQSAGHFIQRLGIRTPSPNQLLRNLSGGNQQKVILARWLGENLKVILLDEPTRGIDIAAKSEIYSIIYDLASRGLGVIVVSSELPEVMGICDRLLVMRQGQIVAGLDRSEATPQRLLQLALPLSSAA